MSRLHVAVHCLHSESQERRGEQSSRQRGMTGTEDQVQEIYTIALLNLTGI